MGVTMDKIGMKKVFIVAPTFPPSALPPAQRVRLLIKHLPALDWRPVIFTVNHRFRGDVADPWLEAITGDDFGKIEVSCLPERLTRIFGVGDLGIRMLPFLFFSLLREVNKQKPDLILYPVPPWFPMTIAPVIKLITKIPYVIDFIDPWVSKMPPTPSLKRRINHWLARLLEGTVVKNSSGLIAVSTGILADLQKRHPAIAPLPQAAIPYGVEASDYAYLEAVKSGLRKDKRIVVRYIGAISDAMLEPVRALLQALKQVHNRLPLRVDFIGTSYASGLFTGDKHRIASIIQSLKVDEFVKESPERVPYSEALNLTNDADLLLLIGDTTQYYAASKLMGLIASRKPFFAFLHINSFPCDFLNKFSYPHLVTYDMSDPRTQPDQVVSGASQKIEALISGLENFQPLDTSDPVFRNHTAFNMADHFRQIFESAIDE